MVIKVFRIRGGIFAGKNFDAQINKDQSESVIVKEG